MLLAAIAGMKPEYVTIADVNGAFTSGPRADGGANEDAYAHAVRAAERI